MGPWRRRREVSNSFEIPPAPILNLPHEVWLCIQHFVPSSDCLAVSTSCRALRSFLYPITFRRISIRLAPLPSSGSLDALVNSPVPQFVHTLRIVRDPRRDTVWLALKAAAPTFQRLFRRLINVRSIVLMDLNTSLPSYLSGWMFKNKSLEVITFKGLNEGKFPKDFWSQLSPSLHVSVQYEPPGNKQVYFLDAAPITQLQTSWSHLFTLMQSSNGPSFDRLTVLSLATGQHKNVLEVFGMLICFPTLQKLLLRGVVAHEYLQGSQDLPEELIEVAKVALPSLQEVTTTSYDFLTTLLLDKRPLRRVECRETPKDANNFIFSLLRAAHSTVETLGFQCAPEEFELLEKIRLFQSLRSLYVTLVAYSWSPVVIPETCPPLPETLAELHIVCNHTDRSINYVYAVDLYEVRGQLFKLLQHLQSATLLLHQVFVTFSPDFRRPLLYRCARVADREWAIRELNRRPSKPECRAISLLNGYAIGPRTVEPGSDFDWYGKKEDWE